MKKKKIVMGCLVVALLFMVVGIAYASFVFSTTGSTNTITSGKINFSYTEPSNSYTIDNAMPTYDSDGKASTDYFEFIVSSNATTNSDDSIGVSLPFEISIESVSVDTGKTALDNDEIKVYLTSVASGTETEELAPTLISELVDSSYSGKLVLSGTHTYKNNSSAISNTYRLRAWIDSNVDASSWSTSSSYQYKFKINVNSNGQLNNTEVIDNDYVLYYPTSEVYVSKSSSDWTIEQIGDTNNYRITGFVGDLNNSADVKVLKNYYTTDTISRDSLFFKSALFAELDNCKTTLYNYATDLEESNCKNAILEKLPSKDAYIVTVPSVVDGHNITEVGIVHDSSNDDNNFDPNALFISFNEDYSEVLDAFNIKEIIISSGITKVNTFFGGNLNLKKIIFPNTLITISDYFAGMISINNIVIPKSVVSIGNYAFFETSLDNIIFEGADDNTNSLKTIGNYAFYQADNPYHGIYLDMLSETEREVKKYRDGDENANPYISERTFSYSADEIRDEYNYDENYGKLIIPSTVETIGDYAFGYVPILELVFMGAGVNNASNLTSIGSYVFNSHLLYNESVYLPSSLTTAGSLIFDSFKTCVFSACGTSDGNNMNIYYYGSSIPDGFTKYGSSASWNQYHRDSYSELNDLYDTYISDGLNGWIKITNLDD